MALIEIDGLPSYKMVDLSMAMLNKQMVIRGLSRSTSNHGPSGFLWDFGCVQRWYMFQPGQGCLKCSYCRPSLDTPTGPCPGQPCGPGSRQPSFGLSLLNEQSGSERNWMNIWTNRNRRSLTWSQQHKWWHSPPFNLDGQQKLHKPTDEWWWMACFLSKTLWSSILWTYLKHIYIFFAGYLWCR